MVPNNKSPVFTMAMRNLIISLSAFTLAEKVSAQEKFRTFSCDAANFVSLCSTSIFVNVE